MRFAHPEAILHWPAPNYVDPVRRGPALYIVNSIFFSFATIAVIARLYTRIFIRRWFGPDDALILFAWLSGIGDLAVIFYGYRNIGWDRHMWDAKPEYLTPGARATVAAKIFWTTTSTFIRLSLLCSFYRLLNHIQLPRYRWALHLNLFLVLGVYASFLGTTIWSCVPSWAYYVWPSPGRCINEPLAVTVLSGLNTFSEALVAALPIPVIMELHMDRRTKWAVSALLCLGFLVAVVGTVRTYYVWKVFNSNDFTWWTSPHWICSEVEICVAMCCASAPALKPVVSRLISKPKVARLGTNSWSHFSSRFQLSASKSSVKSEGSHAITRKLNRESLLTPYDGSQHRRAIDVEGIRVDGLGYTVTITTARNDQRSKLRRLISARNRITPESVARPEQAWGMQRTESSGASSQRDQGGGVSRTEISQGIEVMETQTLEVVVEAYDQRPAKTQPGRERTAGSNNLDTSLSLSDDGYDEWKVRPAS